MLRSFTLTGDLLGCLVFPSNEVQMVLVQFQDLRSSITAPDLKTTRAQSMVSGVSSHGMPLVTLDGLRGITELVLDLKDHGLLAERFLRSWSWLDRCLIGCE